MDMLWIWEVVFNIELMQSGVLPSSLLSALEHLLIYATITIGIQFIKHK